MDTACVIFGGSGFIGTHLARFLLESGLASHVHVADIRPSPLAGEPGISTSVTDVRNPVPVDICPRRPEWIFNLAAIHREPGHEPFEFFDTNLQGATNVCTYAEATGCDRLFFSSSISVYGPTTVPTSETSRICPTTPYGGSKYPAELIHRCWQERAPGRRLVICRPAVVYGPGDPGNILRMIRAVRRGYFAIPGSASIHKSYAYIYGLLDSISFVMKRTEPVIVYNYAENPTAPLGELVVEIKRFMGSAAPVFSIPTNVLLPLAYLAQASLGAKNPIHPTRVKKAAMPTHIIPGWLSAQGFDFRFSFEKSLTDWSKRAPQDFV